MGNIIVITNQLGDFMTNCYTAYHSDTREAVIIDPASNGDFLYKQLENQRLKCVGILLTHGHLDHIGGIPALLEKLGDVPVYAATEEKEVLEDPASNLSTMFTGRPYTLTPDVLLEDGQVIELLGTKLRCILVPGHTKGGMCYYFEEDGILFSGDTLFAGSIGRSDFPTGNGSLLISTIQEKLFALPDETTVYPGHNQRTTIGREKKYNPFFGEF